MKRLAGSRSHEGVLHAVLSLACLNLAPGPPRGASDHFVSASIVVISDPLAIIQRMMRWRASRRGLKCKDFRRAKPGEEGDMLASYRFSTQVVYAQCWRLWELPASISSPLTLYETSWHISLLIIGLALNSIFFSIPTHVLNADALTNAHVFSHVRMKKLVTGAWQLFYIYIVCLKL